MYATLNTGAQYGFMVLDPQWGLSTGVQKTILQNKGTLRFNITDILWTNLPKAVITYYNYIEKWMPTAKQGLPMLLSFIALEIIRCRLRAGKQPRQK